MKKLTGIILAILILAAGLALAEGRQAAELPWTESVTYHGEGIFEIDFMKDIPWRGGFLMTVQDDAGNPLTCSALGGDASEAVVQLQGSVREDALYTFTLVDDGSVMYAVGLSTKGYTYPNHCEYCLESGHDEKACAQRQAAGVYEVDRCDLCGELNHEDDACPDRKSGPYCDECGEYGHDDDVCSYYDSDDPYDRCGLCGEPGHDENRCSGIVRPTPLPAESAGAQQVAASSTPLPKQNGYCDECYEYGHDDDECPYERCDRCGAYGHDDDHCPDRTCKRCGEKGHSGDACPTKRCDECGGYGHDDDDCPNERCDECGGYGHDDDDCPNERCDECGEYGHDDDHCPNERHHRDHDD